MHEELSLEGRDGGGETIKMKKIVILSCVSKRHVDIKHSEFASLNANGLTSVLLLQE